MIIARIESLIAGKTVEDALKRAKHYLQAGVDGIMIHSKSEDPSKILEFAKKYQNLCDELNLKKPLISVPTTYNSIYESELANNGINIVIYANHMLRSAYKAMEGVGKIILKNERSLEADPHISSIKQIFEKVGFLDIKEKDKLLSTTPSIIIPAAGENSELKYLLRDLPKTLVNIGTKTLLEHQISLFKKFGLNDINIIIGYQKEKFNRISERGINYFHNLEYNSTGILHSLMKAKEKMHKGFIYLSSDILLDGRLIEELIQRKEDIVLVIDNSYLYHKHEIDKKLDAVITKSGRSFSYQKLRSSDDEVISIGKEIPKEKMTHEYINIAKFSKQGAKTLIKVYEELKEKHQGRFHESESFEKATDVDMLQELIERGIKIAVHETNCGWLEVHNEKDLDLAKGLFREN